MSAQANRFRSYGRQATQDYEGDDIEEDEL